MHRRKLRRDAGDLSRFWHKTFRFRCLVATCRENYCSGSLGSVWRRWESAGELRDSGMWTFKKLIEIERLWWDDLLFGWEGWVGFNWDAATGVNLLGEVSKAKSPSLVRMEVTNVVKYCQVGENPHSFEKYTNHWIFKEKLQTRFILYVSFSAWLFRKGCAGLFLFW